MLPTQIQGEVARSRALLTSMEERRAEIADQLQQALAVERRHFREGDVIEHRRALAQLEQRIAHANERIAALESQLPNPEQVASARESATELRRQAESAGQRFESAARRYLELMDQAETAARELVAARTESHSNTAKVIDLAVQFGVDVERPTPAELRSVDAKVAMLAGRLISEAASGEPSDTVLRNLAAARAERDRLSVPAAAEHAGV